MKRLLLIVSALLVSLSATAQQYEVFGGLSLPTIAYPANSNQDKGHADMVTNFHFGARTYINLSKGVHKTIGYGIIGVMFSGKGYNLKDYRNKYDLTVFVDTKGWGYSADFPVHFGLYIPVSKDIAIMPETGVTPSFGLFGKWKTSARYNNHEASEVFDGDYYDRSSFSGFRRIDASLNASVGVEIQGKYTVRAGYDYGIINQTSGRGYPVKAKSRNLTLSFGYKFW